MAYGNRRHDDCGELWTDHGVRISGGRPSWACPEPDPESAPGAVQSEHDDGPA